VIVDLKKLLRGHLMMSGLDWTGRDWLGRYTARRFLFWPEPIRILPSIDIVDIVRVGYSWFIHFIIIIISIIIIERAVRKKYCT